MKKIFLSESKLYELMDNPVDYQITKDTNSSFETNFIIEEIPYVFEATYYRSMDMWEIYFYIDSSISFENKEDYYGITNTGNQFTVFATVGKILIDFVKKNKPNKFQFSAKEKSRKRLYDVLAKEITRKIPYSYSSQRDEEELFFTFEKN